MKKFIYLLISVALIYNLSYAQKNGSEYGLVKPQKKGIMLPNKTLGSPVDIYQSILKGANYVKMSQADITEDNAGNGAPDSDNQTGGWYWNATYPQVFNNGMETFGNLYGTTSLGLYYAYLKTNNAQIKTAFEDAMNGLMILPEARSSYNLLALIRYSQMPGINAKYMDTAKARFDFLITYKGAGTATGYAQYLRDVRAGQGYHNGIIPWDIAGLVLVAKALDEVYPGNGYLAKAQEIAEVLYQDSFNNNPGYFKPTDSQNKGWDPTYANTNFWWYSLGVSGLIDAFVSANIHTDKLAELVTLLMESRYTTGAVRGAFSGSYGAHVETEFTDDDWQTTTYCIQSLARVNQVLNQNIINEGVYYLAASQQSWGGWMYSDNSHYPSIGGEIVNGMAFGENATILYVDDNYTSTSCGGHFWGYDAFNKIQDAVEAAGTNAVINVYPGSYREAAPNKFVLTSGNGPHKFGIFVDKDNLTIQGVDISGNPITNANNVLADITTNSTSNFGPDGIFVQGNTFKLYGLLIKDNYNDANVIYNNKTVDVIGNGFDMKYCKMMTDGAAGGEWLAVYMGEWDASTLGTIQSYNISDNIFTNAAISINNGAGSTGARSLRTVLNNTFTGANPAYYLGFRGWNGANPAQGWILYPVGGAIISGNTFSGDITTILNARGNVGGFINEQFDWNQIYTANTFAKKCFVLNNVNSFTPQTYSIGDYPNSIALVSKVQSAIDYALAGNTVKIGNGTYLEAITINKPITVSGENRDNVIIKGPYTIGQTVLLGQGCTLEKVTVTRSGNTVPLWPDGTNLNTSGVIFAQGNTSAILQDVKVTENRNGVYINNSQGNIVRNCLITNNRTGVQLVNEVTNTLFENNEISNNWTAGFVIYYAGILVPTTNCVVRNNNIFGNWYSSLDCKTVLTYSNPTVSYNFANNWWGTENLNVVTTPAGEPGYNAQIPVQFGGTAVNPGGNEGKISGDLSAKIIYEPYLGMAETFNVTNASLNSPINFNSANTSATFTNLPPNTNGTLTIQRLSQPPSGIELPPSSAGVVAPIYLNINATGLVNNTFNVTITVDVSNIPNFSAGTEVMFFSTSTNSWVGLDGTYNPGNQTYTFVTDHFTPFAFVNPLNPDNLYLSQTIANPDQNTKWYPKVGMGDATPISNDWRYTNVNTTFYAIPTGTQGLMGAKFYIEWDKSKLPNVTVTAGDFFTNGMFFTQDLSTGNNGKIEVNTASFDQTQNTVPGGGKYFAKFDFTGMKPGHTSISISGADIRYYDNVNNEQLNVYTTAFNGKVFFYLGDIAKTGDETMGDGKINFEDVTLFTAAYWSLLNQPNYKWKYDIGPTNANGSYWATPTPDGKIEFEDLVIFAIGYGKYGAGELPQLKNGKVNVSTDKMFVGSDGYLRTPIKITGDIKDIRALSLEFNKPSGFELLGVETQGQLADLNGFIAGKEDGNKILLDAAVVSEPDGLNKEGVIANVIYKQRDGQALLSILNVKGRNSGNMPIELLYSKDNLTTGIPTVFDLGQNYPNPFNPVTTVKYQLPKDVKVNITVYDMLGREISVLVNEFKKAGYYDVTWNASSSASGVYFYKIQAGEFSSIKKMVVLK